MCDFFWRANEQKPTAFFCQPVQKVYEEIKKAAFCALAKNFLHKSCTQKFSLDLSKGDIFLSRARVNTRAEESCSRFIIAVVVK